MTETTLLHEHQRKISAKLQLADQWYFKALRAFPHNESEDIPSATKQCGKQEQTDCQGNLASCGDLTMSAQPRQQSQDDIAATHSKPLEAKVLNSRNNNDAPQDAASESSRIASSSAELSQFVASLDQEDHPLRAGLFLAIYDDVKVSSTDKLSTSIWLQRFLNDCLL